MQERGQGGAVQGTGTTWAMRMHDGQDRWAVCCLLVCDRVLNKGRGGSPLPATPREKCNSCTKKNRHVV